MPARVGLGPVFALEWLLASRRWQMYAVRALAVSLLLDALLFIWGWASRDVLGFNPQPLSDYKAYGRIGELFFGAVVATQLALILLAAPAATAGAVCQDKLRGNLLHLLATDLSAAEIILGKLAARLLPVLGLIACSVPVLMICTLLGGVDPYAVAAAYAVMLGVGVLGSALALLLSVWGRKPHEVLLVVYLIEALCLLAHPIAAAIDAVLFRTGVIPAWLLDLNPFWLALAPNSRPYSVEWWEYGQYLLVTLGAAATCTLLAILRVRPVALGHGAVVRRPKATRVRRPWGLVLDRNPLLWYERHRRRPSRWVQTVWLVYGGFAVGGSLLALHAWLQGRMLGGMAPRFWAVLVNTLLPPLGLLLAGVSALTAFAEERVRRNLDELLATPLPTQAIVWAKWREAFRPVPWVVAPPAALSALLAWGEGGGWRFVGLLAGLVLGCGAFLTSLGLALATWIPQLSRAMTYGVGLYFFLCLGWPIAALILFDNPTGGLEVGPALLSPVVAGGVLTSALQSSSVRNIAETGRLFAWGVGWIGVLFAAAGALYYLTVTTFDRCLGRMPEGGRPRTDELTTTRFRRAATAAR